MNQQCEDLSESQSQNLEHFRAALLKYQAFEIYAGSNQNHESVKRNFLDRAADLALNRNEPEAAYWLCRNSLSAEDFTNFPIATIITMLEGAVKKKHVGSMHLLGQIYTGWYDAVPLYLQNYDRGIKLLKRAVKRNSGPAFLTLINLYSDTADHFYNRFIINRLTKKFAKRNYAGAYYATALKLLGRQVLSEGEKKRLFAVLKHAESLIPSLPHGDEMLADDIRFQYGVCLYYGIGCHAKIDDGLDLIELAEKTCNEAKRWLTDRGYKDPVVETAPEEKLPDTEEKSDESRNDDNEDTESDEDFSLGVKLDKPFLPPDVIKEVLETPTPPLDLSPEKIEALLEPLDRMIGLGSIKRQIRQLLNMVRIQEQRRLAGLKTDPISLHMVFSGNPGTGKTTVARLLGDIFKGLGLLSRGHVVEVSRDDLVGQYIGTTETLTKKAITKAQGGILFIDEAYTLTDEDFGWDFGMIAVDGIAKAMEDKRNSFIVITAGYKDDMDQFLKATPGLSSRFSFKIDFPDYTPEEMAMIFEDLCTDKDYTVTDNTRPALVSGFKRMREKTGKRFGNARDVRQVFEKTLLRQAERLGKMADLSKEDLMLIELHDIAFPQPTGDEKVTYLR